VLRKSKPDTVVSESGDSAGTYIGAVEFASETPPHAGGFCSVVIEIHAVNFVGETQLSHT